MYKWYNGTRWYLPYNIILEKLDIYMLSHKHMQNKCDDLKNEVHSSKTTGKRAEEHPDSGPLVICWKYCQHSKHKS